MQGVDSPFVFGTAAFETHAAVVFAVGMHCCIVVSSAPVFGRLIQPPRPSALHFAKKRAATRAATLYSSSSGTSARGSTLVEKTI